MSETCKLECRAPPHEAGLCPGWRRAALPRRLTRHSRLQLAKLLFACRRFIKRAAGSEQLERAACALLQRPSPRARPRPAPLSSPQACRATRQQGGGAAPRSHCAGGGGGVGCLLRSSQLAGSYSNMSWNYTGFMAEKVEAGRRLLASDPTLAGNEDLRVRRGRHANRVRCPKSVLACQPICVCAL